METETESTIRTAKPEIEELNEIVTENRRLLEENNKLLKKINRSNTWAFWLRILWIAILLGIPVLVYYYLLAPYYESLDSAFQYFGVELPAFPNWDGESTE